jgi:DNA-binding CsgD family transcriptional regulator
MVERSLDLAIAAGLEEHVARAYTNLGATAVELRDYAFGRRHLDAGIAYCAERDLDAWLIYMLGHRARVELDQGEWDAAAMSARAVLDRPNTPPPSRVTPLVVVGLLRARRGDPDQWSPLAEALELAEGTTELQRLAPVATARAEARWLAGEPDEIATETAVALALALTHNQRWVTGELYVWRRRAGLCERVSPATVAEPHRHELAGAHAAAAESWRARGCPYEAALALAHADEEDLRRRALAELQQLSARPAAARVARALREGGARDLRQGPRASTRRNPAGLTLRELEVLSLVTEGLRNAQIAERLFVTEKTVAHHVSAILRKLKVHSRSQAAAEAARLGIVER